MLSKLLEDHLHLVPNLKATEGLLVAQSSTLLLMHCSLNDSVPITDPKVALTLACAFDSTIIEEFPGRLH